MSDGLDTGKTIEAFVCEAFTWHFETSSSSDELYDYNCLSAGICEKVQSPKSKAKQKKKLKKTRLK